MNHFNRVQNHDRNYSSREQHGRPFAAEAAPRKQRELISSEVVLAGIVSNRLRIRIYTVSGLAIVGDLHSFDAETLTLANVTVIEGEGDASRQLRHEPERITLYKTAIEYFRAEV